MKKFPAILIILVVVQNARAQDISFGVTLGTHAFYKAKLDTPYYFSSNSFLGYYSGDDNKPVINKIAVLNSFSIGSVITASVKRWSFTLEPQYFFQRTVLRFKYPINVERVFGRKAFRMPLYFSYKMYKKENSTYWMFGLIIHKENNYDFQNPGREVYLDNQPFGTVAVDYGDNHFYRVLYTEKAYFSYTFGLGKVTRKGFNYALKVHKRLNTKSRGISANIFNIEFSVIIPVVSISDFTNKHFIYVD